MSILLMIPILVVAGYMNYQNNALAWKNAAEAATTN